MRNAAAATADDNDLLLDEAFATARALRREAAARHAPPIDSDSAATRYAPQIDRLTALFNDVSFTPAYTAWQDEKRAALIDRIANDRSLAAAVTAPWRNAAAEDLLARAAILCHEQCAAYGLENYSAPLRVTWLPAAIRFTGRYRPPDRNRPHHEIAFNVARHSDFRHAAAGLDAIHHETIHLLQWELGNQWRRGALSPHHRLAADARLLSQLMNDEIAYFPGTRAYYAHPLERDAYAQGHKFVAGLQDALQAKNLTLPPR